MSLLRLLSKIDPDSRPMRLFDWSLALGALGWGIFSGSLWWMAGGAMGCLLAWINPAGRLRRAMLRRVVKRAGAPNGALVIPGQAGALFHAPRPSAGDPRFRGGDSDEGGVLRSFPQPYRQIILPLEPDQRQQRHGERDQRQRDQVEDRAGADHVSDVHQTRRIDDRVGRGADRQHEGA